MDDKLPFFIDVNNSLSKETFELLTAAYEKAIASRHEYITPEHVLYALILTSDFHNALQRHLVDVDNLKDKLNECLDNMVKVPEGFNFTPSSSMQLQLIVQEADHSVTCCGKTEIENLHIIKSIFHLTESWARYLLWNAIDGEVPLFIARLLDCMNGGGTTKEEDIKLKLMSEYGTNVDRLKTRGWKNQVVCINDIYQRHNPLIGREDELLKTIRVLCRKDKNNPLHIGDPGVGKTALVYGLASMIEKGDVPEKLKGAKIYSIDLGGLIAGTEYRGSLEKKIKQIMDGVGKEPKSIVYIDEIHNLVGLGTIKDNSLDASNIIKPYLEDGRIRFIGATTYDDYKRYFAKDKSIIRRFTNIDISEPSVEDAINILRQLQGRYEEFHNVKYTDEAIEYAVKGSAKHINERFLPDKAIDLLDECGAELQIASSNHPERVVDKELISKVLSKICKVESLAITEEDPRNLETIEERISSQLFGQEKAVEEVSEAILMSKAGLNDDNKPIASMLFVGPTGVGKTELARLLAKELGVELIRFDMSEYAEKHTVAKLIGSPAGYIGYEDGGLLTDAIRKTPNAVLLLDEIEKAHPDIYNILLQVMDYAKLSDNKGNKADFRNVVLIMTSNAGAQFAAQSNVGFASNVRRGETMMKQVKKTFKPEFLNRLSAAVVFNDMTKEMAYKILDKKLNELEKKLETKNMKMEVSDGAKEFLLEKGFTKEYGARELERVIQHHLKRLLMKELLHGGHSSGHIFKIDLRGEKLTICRK